MKTTLFIGGDLGAYGFGEGHPFGPDRMEAFWRETQNQNLDQRVTLADPVTADADALARFHTTEYIDRVQTLSRSGHGYIDGGDTPAFKGVFEVASTVVGSVLKGCELMLEELTTRVFVPIAGLHHARRDSAAGFCVFNDIGVLIETLREVYQLGRIAYVDIDAHHGDGVFYAFEQDPDLAFADIHEDGRFLYPGTGAAEETGSGAALGTKLNIPLPPGAGDSDFYSAWERVASYIEGFEPEFIIFQAGADSIQGDPITHLNFSPAAHGHAARCLCDIADKMCNGRVLALGGGGYNRSNLAKAWNEVVSGLLG
jgi:acetoin utilization protein AcuC|tara:strand:+ start:623 stop:1561 length:939 start_codon:yes stop_codon:yes gene_type:complete